MRSGILYHISRMWNEPWCFELYFPHAEHALVFFLNFPACETRTGILCYIFLRVEHTLVFCVFFTGVERALAFCIIFFRVWNENWYFVLYSFVSGIRTGILYYIFTRVE